MTISLLGSLAGALLGWLMGFLSLFLIMLILIQRGKGGGLTGALGGPGGQSAFGSKAGDTFTAITIVVASIWGFTCAFTMWLLGTHTPTTVTETNVSAGPGDDEGTEPIFPPAGGSGMSDFGGIGGLSAGDDSAAPTQTPSLDLTPLEPQSPTTDSDSAESDPAEPAKADPDDPPGGDSPDADSPEADSPETDAPQADAPEADAPEADAGDTDATNTGGSDAGGSDSDGSDAGGSDSGAETASEDE